MRHYCTYFDHNYLTRGLALHRSLLAHAGDFALTVLCMDDAAEKSLRAQALPRVRVMAAAELIRRHPPLAAAQKDRSNLEFYFTCTSWLMLDLLPGIPAGELLTYLDADLYFFSSPQPVYDEIGNASVAITPHRFPASLAHLERYGKFNVGWVSFRHDATGLACARDWAEKCAAWCFNRLEDERYADQKYLDAWPGKFPGTVSLQDAGVNVAPWNIRDSVVSGGAAVKVNQRRLVFYHFHALTHLGRNLYDPGLHRYDATASPELRELVYLPYLRELAAPATPATDLPDLVPPSRADDGRHALAYAHLGERLRASELDRATRLESVEAAQRATQETIAYFKQVEQDRADSQRALAEAQAATGKTIAYLKLVEKDRDEARAALQQTVAYLQSVEQDSAERLKSIETYQEKLRTAYADLERNVAYLKTLEAEIQAHLKVAAERDALIANLSAQLNAARPPPPAGT